MAISVVNSNKRQLVGFAPTLQCYYERCAIAKIRGGRINLDSCRKIFTRKQASMAMITRLKSPWATAKIIDKIL